VLPRGDYGLKGSAGTDSCDAPGGVLIAAMVIGIDDGDAIAIGVENGAEIFLTGPLPRRLLEFPLRLQETC
jgi:hypothetical protein